MSAVDKRILRRAALAGMLGPLLLGGALAILTLAQYDFMRSLGWHPLAAPTTDWPSGLALGRYGAWMTGTFVVCGLLLLAFAQGLRRALRSEPAGRFGALLLAFAGGALVALSAPTDPTFGGGPPTIPGRVHDLAFAVLGLTFWPALLALAWGFRRHPRWRAYAPFTALVALLVGPAFLLKGLMFYGLLLGAIVWCEAVALRLWRLAASVGAPRNLANLTADAGIVAKYDKLTLQWHGISKGKGMSDFNRAIIEEFRANSGKVGGYFAGANMLLLHTIGARSGQARTNPLVYVADGDRLVVVASKGGADSNPDWYYNLLANPNVTVELGNERFQARAKAVTEEPERSRLYAKMVEHRSGFAEYERKTSRTIPVVILERER